MSQPFHTFTRHMRGHTPNGKNPMLTAAEETALVATMHDKVNATARERKLAREKLITSYLPLARRMAHMAAKRGIVAKDDLESEAKLALTVAIDKFDPTRGTRISTPASIEIKSALMQYVMYNSGPTRLGTNFDDKKIFMRLRAIASTIEREKGRSIQDEDIAKIATDLGVKTSAVARMLPRIFSSDTTVASTDAVTEDDSPSNTIKGLAYIAAEGGQEARDIAMDTARIFDLMEKEVDARWTGRNHEIILAYLRHESDTDTLAALAQKHDISVERVRQIWREGREHLRVFLQVHESINSVEDISL